MARAPRIDFVGYYHVLNRGVEKRDIFLEDDDYAYFLALIGELKTLYHFHVHAYALMSNHYHLLLETSQENLSLIMKQLNQRYTLYFNKKYKRVGTLWQGRFKSWYVHDDHYCEVLTKYIEHNPLKAGISEAVGEYRWASAITKESPFLPEELQQLTQYQNEKITYEHNEAIQSKSLSLNEYFSACERNRGIMDALKNGYTQHAIASYLKLSDVAVSKIVKTEKGKEKLFNKLKQKGIFWSYASNITLREVGAAIFIEYTLKYADFDDIVELFAFYGKKFIFKIWSKELKNDLRFKKLNLFLARVFFKMDVEADYFKGGLNEREKKFRLLAS